MKQIVRANTPFSNGSSSQDSLGLAPKMVQSAATRLCWISLLCAGVTALSLVLQHSLQPEMAAVMKNPLPALMWLFVMLLSLGMVAVQRFHLLAPVSVLRIGLGFEVAVAFAISFFETSLQLPVDQPVFGCTKIAAWIAVVGLLIPNRPMTKLITALCSASTWPVAYYLNLHLNGFQPLPWTRLAAWVYLPYVLALVTYAVAKRIYSMEVEAEKARELGSYELVSLIGKGGMGEVWRARHHMLARDAAIKLVRSELMMGLSGRQAKVTRSRFEREAQAIAALQCPHTVYLFDFGAAQDGSFYYVMELLDGISLEAMVEQFGPQPPERVIHLLRQICDSLEEAHRHGLVHRDIKPSNIFSCRLGLEYDFAKVLDFGLVKDVSPRSSTQLTMEGTSAGTPAYMAPEVALGDENVDGRVDIYGLGCVAYFLLTGSPVFNENSPTATALAHVQKPPVPPSQRSEVPIPDDLEAVVLRCLEKKREDRPHSARELNRMLSRCRAAGEWTKEDAHEWWQAYLPESSTYRLARQPRTAAVQATTEA
jgi:eukaryotic-like serine/threonine-protein kinase